MLHQYRAWDLNLPKLKDRTTITMTTAHKIYIFKHLMKLRNDRVTKTKINQLATSIGFNVTALGY